MELKIQWYLRMGSNGFIDQQNDVGLEIKSENNKSHRESG